jgi:hypothetical protein
VGQLEAADLLADGALEGALLVAKRISGCRIIVQGRPSTVGYQRWLRTSTFQERDMRFPRMTTRRWMIAVAFLGILFAGAIHIGRYLALRHAYLRRAALHETWKGKIFNNPRSSRYWEVRWREQRAGLKGSYPWPDEPPFVPAISEYHDRMTAKWRFAADHPWREVEPDPIATGP